MVFGCCCFFFFFFSVCLFVCLFACLFGFFFYFNLPSRVRLPYPRYTGLLLLHIRPKRILVFALLIRMENSDFKLCTKQISEGLVAHWKVTGLPLRKLRVLILTVLGNNFECLSKARNAFLSNPCRSRIRWCIRVYCQFAREIDSSVTAEGLK